MPFSEEQRLEEATLLFQHNLNAGAASPNALYFFLNKAWLLTRLTITASASDATDKVAAKVRTGTTDILITAATGTALIAHATAAETGQTLSRTRGETLNMLLVYSGTAANVLGISVQVWGVRRTS